MVHNGVINPGSEESMAAARQLAQLSIAASIIINARHQKGKDTTGIDYAKQISETFCHDGKPCDSINNPSRKQLGFLGLFIIRPVLCFTGECKLNELHAPQNISVNLNKLLVMPNILKPRLCITTNSDQLS